MSGTSPFDSDYFDVMLRILAKTATCLMIGLAAISSAAQQKATEDSLLHVFRSDTSQRGRLDAAVKLARQYRDAEPLSLLDISTRGLHLLDSLHTAKALPDSVDFKYRQRYLRYQGLAYHNLGDAEKELESCMTRLKLVQQQADPALEGDALNNIGMAFWYQGNMDEAGAYFRRAMDRDGKMGDTLAMAIQLGNVVSAMGTDHLDSNLALLRRSLMLMERSNAQSAKASKAWMLQNIGETLADMGDIDSAYIYYDRSLALRESIDHRMGQIHVHRAITELLVKQQRWKEALQHIDKGIRIAEQNGYRDTYREYDLRSTILARLGRYKEALDDHIRSVALHDTIVNEGNSKALVQQTMRYEYGKKLLADSLSFAADKAVQAKEIQKQKVIRNGFVGGFALVALFAGVFFLQRNRISKARKRSDELLLNILPEEVAEELKAKGEAEAVHIDQVTVLFTDFKGFTAMSERLSPKELVKDLHECFSAFDAICEKHGIEKIKTIGDAYMAAGGLPTPNTTHPTDVIRAALEMRDFIADGKERKIAAGLPYFEIRIGIHTGPVVAGIVGVKKFQYDIWGDTVNTASRMESSGEVGKVNISEATYRLVVSSQLSVVSEGGPDRHLTTDNQQLLKFTPRGKVQAKGKGEMEMYFVERSA